VGSPSIGSIMGAMTTSIEAPRTPAFAPSYRGFLRMCEALGVALAPHQRTIGRAVFGEAREVACIAPRGSAKTTSAALLALHALASRPDAAVFIGASSRDQARIAGRIVNRYARHPALREMLIVRTDQVRAASGGLLQVVAADGAKAHGWERPTLMLADEVWSWSDREPTLLGAMQTSLIKNPQAKLVIISTAPASKDQALGKMRARALAQVDVHRRGAFLEARGDIHWIEWSLPEEADPEDIDAVAAVNVAPWIGRDDLAAQRKRVSETEWLQFHCNRSAVQSTRWLPRGAWEQCRADYEVGEQEPLTLGIDIGGSRSATGLVGCVADEDGVRVALVEVRQGRAAVLEVVERVRELAATRNIAQIVFDPMRFESEAQRLEQELGVPVIEWPQSETRMTRCSENLHRLVTEGRLRHPGDAELDRHAAGAIAKPTPRGWRLVKSADAVQIDALIALAMAAEQAERAPRPAQFLGWL
jgi:phage terminase large subunit-like protein